MEKTQTKINFDKISCHIQIESAGINTLLISLFEYGKWTEGKTDIYCMPSEYSNIVNSKKKRKKVEILELASFFQKNISKGIFVLCNDTELIVGCALFDNSLSWTIRENTLIVSDSANNIANCCNLSISKSLVALNLISSLPYYPFQNISLWEDIKKIHPFCILKYGENQKVEEIEMWKAPMFSNNVELSQKNIRERLLELARNAASTYSNFSADISGGVDSATIAYVLKAHHLDVKLYHSKADSEWNSDSKWATMIANDMNDLLLPLPSISASGRRFETNMEYPGLIKPDSPVLWADTEGYVENIVNNSLKNKNSVHFIGIGGDELFTPMPAYAQSIVRQNGIHSLWFLLQYCLYTRNPLLKNVSDIVDNITFKDSIKRELDIGFGYINFRRTKSNMDWGGEITVPPWLAKEVREPCYQMAIKILEQSESLDKDRSRHQALESLLFQKRVLNQLNMLYGTNKISWQAPFLDARIIEFALSIPTHFHLKEGVTKPMLFQTMKGIVPIEVFSRGYKGDYSTALYSGYKRAVSKEMCNIRKYKIVELGIVDPDILATELSMPTALHNRIEAFGRLAAVERWLNNILV